MKIIDFKENNKFNKRNNGTIEYETVAKTFVTKEQAIAIANCDRNLKDSVFMEAKKKDIHYGLITFYKFDIALVQYCGSFAWHIKVKYGEWGATEYKRLPILRIPINTIMSDGYFDEESNISCIVMCDSGEYYYCNEINIDEIKAPDMERYNDFLNSSNIYIDFDDE